MLRHGGSRTLRGRVFAVAALFALAATYLTPIVNADWNAWRYDHGHASLAGFVGQHSHPWDVKDDPSTASSDEGGFAYTAHGDSVPGVTAIQVPSSGAAAISVLSVSVEAEPAQRLSSAASVPTSPPPKGDLSHT